MVTTMVDKLIDYHVDCIKKMLIVCPIPNDYYEHSYTKQHSSYQM